MSLHRRRMGIAAPESLGATTTSLATVTEELTPDEVQERMAAAFKQS